MALNKGGPKDESWLWLRKKADLFGGRQLGWIRLDSLQLRFCRRDHPNRAVAGLQRKQGRLGYADGLGQTTLIRYRAKVETLFSWFAEKIKQKVSKERGHNWWKIISDQGGITCEAIDEPGKSSKAIDKRVIINFRDKNVVIARFRDKNEVFVLFII